MLSKTEICNHALLQIGHTERIANIDTERSRAAEDCRAFWSTSLNATLEGANWSFARKVVQLAILVDELAPGYQFAYAYPSDCLIPREIRVEKFDAQMRVDPLQRMPFEIAHSTKSNRRIILTNTPKAHLIYTTGNVETSLFSSTFCNAMAMNLASRLAMSLKKDSGLAKSCSDSFDVLISKANSNDANSQKTSVNMAYDFTVDAISARLS